MSDTAFATETDDLNDLNEADLDLTAPGDEPDADDHGDDTDDDTADSGKKNGAAKRGLDRGAIRRIAAKAQEIDETPKRIVEITASLLGSGTGLADLTTAIMAAPRGAAAPINDLNTVAEAHPMEAAVIAAAMGRDRIKALWALLAALGAGPKGNIPAATPKAAIAVARSVFDLDEVAKGEIEAVATLLKKN